MGALGRSLETGLLLVNVVAKLFDTLAAVMGLVIALTCNGVLNAFTAAGAMGKSAIDVADGWTVFFCSSSSFFSSSSTTS